MVRRRDHVGSSPGPATRREVRGKFVCSPVLRLRRSRCRCHPHPVRYRSSVLPVARNPARCHLGPADQHRQMPPVAVAGSGEKNKGRTWGPARSENKFLRWMRRRRLTPHYAHGTLRFCISTVRSAYLHPSSPTVTRTGDTRRTITRDQHSHPDLARPTFLISLTPLPVDLNQSFHLGPPRLLGGSNPGSAGDGTLRLPARGGDGRRPGLGFSHSGSPRRFVSGQPGGPPLRPAR